MNTTHTPIVPKHKLGIAMQRMVEQGKRPCFRIDNLRITRAADSSANPGYLYIKDQYWNYIGKISPDSKTSIRDNTKITKKQLLLVLAAVEEPEETAMSYGLVTGTCCCCGRTLTNKLSVKLGIGPICRGDWFLPNVADLENFYDLGNEPKLSTSPVDTAAMLGTLDSIAKPLDTWQEEVLKDTLELDLGSPPSLVMDVVNTYNALSYLQQQLFLSVIDKDDAGDRHASN